MKGAVLLLLIAGVAFPSVVGYHIEPVKASWSGRADPEDGVAQTVVACWDSLERIELFAGAKGNGGAYTATVFDGNTQLMYSVGNGVPDHGWVKFEDWNTQVAFTKGKTVTIRFTRGGSDSLEYYYQLDDPYPYGVMLVPGEPTPVDRDLVARVFGRMNPVDSTFWGANFWLPWPTSGQRAWSDSMRSSRVKWGTLYIYWDGCEKVSDSFDFFVPNVFTQFIADSADMELVCVLLGTPKWASTRIDSWWVDTTPGIPGDSFFRVDTSVWAPPCGMDSTGDSNFWVRYLNTLLSAPFANRVHTWSIWNEPNEGATQWYKPGTWPGWTGWWRSPNQRDYNTLDTNWTYRCSLYVQLCTLAANTIRSHPSHTADRIVIGELGHVDLALDDIKLVKGKDWLRKFYDIADGDTTHGRFWNVVSAHPYQTVEPSSFDPDSCQAYAETLRAILRERGDNAELWNTEFNYGLRDSNGISGEDNADCLCKAYASMLAQAALPGGTYDRACWWPSWAAADANVWTLLSGDDVTPNPGYYAFKQTAEKLTGKRLNGRVMTDDTLTGPFVRMYEFEDPVSLKKTWVCWKNGSDNTVVNVKLPARSDTSEAASLDYEGDPQSDPAAADVNGWLSRGIYARPMFITESTAVSRPELVAESLWLSPIWSGLWWIDTVHARIRNRDLQRPTPGSCTVRFTWNDSIVGSICRTDPIDPGETVVEAFVWQLPEWFHGDGLLAANVNPGMHYVEREGTDDNQAYKRLVLRGGIGGTFEVTGPSGGKTDAPLLVCGLSSMSYEKDSTGQESADSARVLFAWYGAQGDSVVHATDTTAWFPFCNDTVLQYPRGCGEYVVKVQYRDSGQNDSPFYGDSTDSIVVFDSVPPAGSIIIEGGGRFASNSTRTLRLAASDSASGVCNMRFMNRQRVDLVANGTFASGGGSWNFENGEVDDSLQMVKLTIWSTLATVTQFVPGESISAYSGDSCVMEASILAHVHDGDAAGSLSFWYLATRPDTWPVPETLYQLADSVAFSGSLLSLTGRSCLSKRFLLAPPDPGQDWIRRGGMVKVEASAENCQGNVWVDNVALNAFKPESAYAWWGPYDTLAEWNIGSTAGQHVVRALYLDSAGTENATPFADTVIFDPTPPVVDISLPMLGQLVNGLVEVTGWAYDPVEVAGDTWFKERRLSYRSVDSTNWRPVSPDSISHTPAYPDSMASQGPAVHLGYWNTLSLVDGPYYLLLTATDSAANTSSCTTWVMVDHGFGGGGMRGGPEGGGSGMGEGSLFVGSGTGSVLHLSDDLDSLDCFQVTDSGSQAYVTAVLEVGNDSLVVLDARNKRLHKLHKDGQRRRRLVSGLSLPMGLTKDGNGNLWLVDRGISRIGKFRPGGTLVFTRGGPGTDSLHFRSPEGIAVKGNLVYVADTKNDRIAVWDTSGNHKTTITGDFENPTAVFAADNGTIYLTDGIDGKLKGITPLGGNIVSIGASDSSKLRGLVPSENKHSLFSLAPQPNKVYKLRIQSDESWPGGQQSAGKVNLPRTLSLAQPFPNPARTRLNIAYALPHQTRVVLKLYDVAGKLVTTLANGEQRPGYYNLTWNRQDSKGRSCACGIYFCTLAAENQRFSRKVILTE